MSFKTKAIILIIVICVLLFFLPKKVRIDIQNISDIQIAITTIDFDNSMSDPIVIDISEDESDEISNVIDTINMISYRNSINSVFINLSNSSTLPYSNEIMSIAIVHQNGEVDTIVLFSDNDFIKYNDKVYLCTENFYYDIYDILHSHTVQNYCSTPFLS